MEFFEGVDIFFWYIGPSLKEVLGLDSWHFRWWKKEAGLPQNTEREGGVHEGFQRDATHFTGYLFFSKSNQINLTPGK